MKAWYLCILILLFSTFAQSAEIRFRQGDSIEVNVFNNPEMSGTFKINQDGYIRIPLAGKIMAAGKTEEELNEAIRSSIDAFIKNPNITIIPKFSVSVLGYVNKPGTFDVTGSEKVIEIIAMAGGFTPEASGKISLYRNGKKIDIEKDSMLYNDAKLGYLQPGDVLLAKKTLFSRSDYTVIVSTLYSIAITFYYLSNR